MIAPDFKEEYREFLDAVKINLTAQMRSQNRIATGFAVNTLRIVANDKLEAELRGVGYFKYLQTGIGAQPKKIGKRFINFLKEWIKAKRIEPRPNEKIKQLAFRIAQSIVYKGTAIKRGQKGISISQAIKDEKPEFLKQVGAKMRIDFVKGLKIKLK